MMKSSTGKAYAKLIKPLRALINKFLTNSANSFGSSSAITILKESLLIKLKALNGFNTKFFQEKQFSKK